MKRKLLIALFTIPAVLSLLSATSCGTPATPTATQTTAKTATTVPGPTASVIIENSAFSPKELTIAAGTTVTWTNHEDIHHMLIDRAGSFGSPLFGKGETFSNTFKKPGTYPYYCKVQAYITGTIIVE
jgi:plastocyanin